MPLHKLVRWGVCPEVVSRFAARKVKSTRSNEQGGEDASVIGISDKGVPFVIPRSVDHQMVYDA